MSGQEASAKNRLDVELVRRGLAVSRSRAQSMILAGKVLVNAVVATKVGQLVAEDTVLAIEADHPWVSRGGLKLAHGLDFFAVSSTGRVCLDIGASTGGFTQVLLSTGARHVFAVDVGRGQIHESLRNDERVTVLEGLDARDLTIVEISQTPALVVCDASFIGLEKVLGTPLSLAAPEADLLGLFKPQFQVGRDFVGKGGIVKDMEAVAAAQAGFVDWLERQGWGVSGWTDSPITGGDGNRELLFHARPFDR